MADTRRVFTKTTTKACRAPTPPRVSLGGAARVSYVYHASHTRVERGEAASGAFARANVGHALRSSACFASSQTSGFSSSETPEPTSSSKPPNSRHAHLARRLALALTIVALVAFVVVESCGARASFPSCATLESFERVATETFETLRPGGPLPPLQALLRDARRHLAKTRPTLVIALMAFLSLNPAPLRRASRETFHALARCLAAREARNWVTAVIALSGPYVGRAARLCVCWALVNHLARLPRVDTSVVLAAPPILQALAGTIASLFGDAEAKFDGSDAREFAVPSLTVGEMRAWFFVASARVLVAALCVLAAQWVMHAKRPPPRPATPAETSPSGVSAAVPEAGVASAVGGERNGSDESSDLVGRHFAALRGDAGVSWDRQAKAVLIDSALSCAVVAASTLSVANALRVDVTGLLAVGGFSGVAFGFAAQRCVANFISGALIFVTQPFKQGDLVATAHAAGEGAFHGVVKQVGWHSTYLESCKDGSVLIVPNEALATAPVRNVSRRERRAALETVPVSLPIEPNARATRASPDAALELENAGRARAAVFAANRAIRAHVGVEPPGVSTGADGGATPRCVLTADPATGAACVACAYVVARDVPEPWVEAVRSAVLVKLREAVAAALAVDERTAEDDHGEAAEDPDDSDSDADDSDFDADFDADFDFDAEASSEMGFDGAVVRELTEHHDHHFPQPPRSSSDGRERQTHAGSRVARSMRRGEREYEAAVGRYRDKDEDDDDATDEAIDAIVRVE